MLLKTIVAPKFKMLNFPITQSLVQIVGIIICEKLASGPAINWQIVQGVP